MVPCWESRRIYTSRLGAFEFRVGSVASEARSSILHGARDDARLVATFENRRSREEALGRPLFHLTLDARLYRRICPGARRDWASKCSGTIREAEIVRLRDEDEMLMKSRFLPLPSGERLQVSPPQAPHAVQDDCDMKGGEAAGSMRPAIKRAATAPVGQAVFRGGVGDTEPCWERGSSTAVDPPDVEVSPPSLFVTSFLWSGRSSYQEFS